MTTEAPVLLAHSWKTDQDPTGWWMSEKLDGVRAYWDGKQFMSRQGNRYDAPAWFTEGLPYWPLDGELWGGRGQFQKTVSIVRTQGDRKANEWKYISFVMFDAPNVHDVFETRIHALHNVASMAPNSNVLMQQKCTGVDHLRSELALVEAAGGEGLMLRKPESLYEVGRSHTLLKVKTFHDDEALVIGYEQGKGRNKDRVGALCVELPNGIKFQVGTGLTDQEREHPPSVGSIITYRYQELTKDNVPRFPSFVRIRPDGV